MKRRYRRIALSAGLGLVALYSIYAFFEDPGPRAATAKVEEGPMSVWSVYNGKIDSRSAITVMSKLKGGATVIDLAAPGAKVSKGDVLVIMEAMKMELSLRAEVSGEIKMVIAQTSGFVDADTLLVELEAVPT